MTEGQIVLIQKGILQFLKNEQSELHCHCKENNWQVFVFTDTMEEIWSIRVKRRKRIWKTFICNQKFDTFPKLIFLLGVKELLGMGYFTLCNIWKISKNHWANILLSITKPCMGEIFIDMVPTFPLQLVSKKTITFFGGGG